MTYNYFNYIKPNSHFSTFNYLLNVKYILMLVVGDTYTTFKCIFITIKKLILNFKENLRIQKIDIPIL